jgi:putative ABC transport system permease protein
MPMGIMTLGKAASFHIIISKEVYQKLVEGTDIENKISGKKLYLNSDEPLKLQENIEEIGESTTDGNINIFNVYIFKQREEQMILLLSVFTYAFIFLITAICIANILNTISTSIALRKREFAMLKSVGITPKGFNKMLRFESIFYGIKALLYGIPISIGAMYLMHGGLTYAFVYPFEIPWSNIIIAVISVFLIVGMSMLYSSSKVKKENIIDALKNSALIISLPHDILFSSLSSSIF